MTELFGIGRGTVNYLVVEKKIKSMSLCHDGLARGSRLISYASVCGYLDALAAEQRSENGNESQNPQTAAQARMDDHREGGW